MSNKEVVCISVSDCEIDCLTEGYLFLKVKVRLSSSLYWSRLALCPANQLLRVPDSLRSLDRTNLCIIGPGIFWNTQFM